MRSRGFNCQKVFIFQESEQAKLIYKAIQKAGSQRKLSVLTGISKGAISSYKSETFLISRKNLEIILTFLNIHLGEVAHLINQELPGNWGQKIGGHNSSGRFSQDELFKHMAYVRKFRKTSEKAFTFKYDSSFFEFYGILMGDGCISQYKDSAGVSRCDLVITGDKRFEVSYFSYIKSMLKDKFNIHAYVYQYRNENTIRLFVRSKPFSRCFLNLGFPCGNKYRTLMIPPPFVSFGWGKLKYLIRGLFDTDGSIFAKRNERYRYPYISLSSKNPDLLIELRSILRRRGYPFYINGQNLVMKGLSNAARWMDDVGTSNQKHSFKYRYLLHHRNLPARLIWAGS
jgi:hypothetical protein